MERAIILMVLLTSNLICAEDWNRHLILDRDGNYHFWWRINGDTAVFQVEVATLGWVGFGISPNGGMKGSDVVIGWVANGNTIFHDRHGEGYFMPAIDKQQNWEILWSAENGTHTLLRFQRRLNTCDENDIPITGDTARLIYAYNSKDPSSADDVEYHGTLTRGTKSVYFLHNKRHRNIVESDLRYWDVRSANALIPGDKDTTYYCTVLKRPELDAVNHVVQIEPLIQAGNERFVHHMVLYECTDREEKELLPYVGGYHECYDERQSPKFYVCLKPYSLWAVGGESFYLPENTGMPFGRSSGVYYVLEVHYDNPGHEKGIVDNSGFRLTYTPKLRKHNIGVLGIGSLPYACMFIPPKQKQFVISGHSHSSCLRQHLPQDGIKVIGVILHSHLIGKSLTIRHFRGQEELAPLASDINYDFNYQSIMIFEEEKVILPIDHLIMECTYDSSERGETTFGGLGTKQEMCTAVLLYYPETSLAWSTSCPLPFNLVKLFGVTQTSEDNKFVISPITGRNESFVSFVNSYPWNEDLVSEVQKTMKFSPHLNVCSNRGNIINRILIFSKYPNVTKRYQEEDICPKWQQWKLM